MSDRMPDGLYPPLEPYRRDRLAVGGGHELAYLCSGNPDGRPVIVLHGGPGDESQDEDRQYFDPERWHIIQFDQRGCGQSRPHGLLEANTTWDTVDDIEALRCHLGLGPVVLWGASWGSTLALVAAIHRPESVAGLLIGGVYLGTKAENDFVTQGNFALFYPEAWDRFVSRVPPAERDRLIAYYYRMMTTGDPHQRQAWAYEWSRFQEVLQTLEPPTSAELDARVKSYPYLMTSVLEATYYLNDCWLPDGFILDCIGAAIGERPLIIIQGRYDLVCPPLWAYQLSRAVPHAMLRMVNAGHDNDDPEATIAWVEATAELDTILDER